MQLVLLGAETRPGSTHRWPNGKWAGQYTKLGRAPRDRASVARMRKIAAQRAEGAPMRDEQSQLSPSATDELAFLRAVMDVFARADVHDSLFWHVGGRLFAMCSDTFWWGTADAEEITPERLPALQQAYEDLAAINGPLPLLYLAELYAARIRQMRPQGAAYPKCAADSPHLAENEAVCRLLDACGPERELDFDNPLPTPRVET